SIACTGTCTKGTCQNGVVAFAGAIVNTGNSTLAGVTVSNLVNGALVRLNPATNTLAPGQSTSYSAGVNNPAPCDAITGSIFVKGLDIETGQAVSSSCAA